MSGLTPTGRRPSVDLPAPEVAAKDNKSAGSDSPLQGAERAPTGNLAPPSPAASKRPLRAPPPLTPRALRQSGGAGEGGVDDVGQGGGGGGLRRTVPVDMRGFVATSAIEKMSRDQDNKDFEFVVNQIFIEAGAAPDAGGKLPALRRALTDLRIAAGGAAVEMPELRQALGLDAALTDAERGRAQANLNELNLDRFVTGGLPDKTLSVTGTKLKLSVLPALYERFAASMQRGENLLFLRQVSAYEGQPDAHFAAALFNAFVADEGPAQINISSKLRKECGTALAAAAATGGVPPANLFTAIKTEIRALEIANTLSAFQLLLQQAMAPRVAGAGAGVK
jgi:hypothetical protein